MRFKIGFLIGTAFTCLALALLGYRLTGNEALSVPWFCISINRAWGIVPLVLGIVIIVLSWRRQSRIPSRAPGGGFRQEIIREARLQLKALFARIYFYYWSWKTEIRHYVKVTSLFALIGLAVLTAVEVGLEFFGRIELSALTAATGLHLSLTILFILAVAYLAWHHWSE